MINYIIISIIILIILIIALIYLINKSATPEHFINKYTGPTEFEKLDTETQQFFLDDCQYQKAGVSNEADRRPFQENDLNVPIYLRKCIKYNNDLCPIWNKPMIDNGLLILSDKNRLNSEIEPTVYPESAGDILRAISNYPIRRQNVLTIGSISPWVETILLYSDARVTVTDYNTPLIENDIPNLRAVSLDKLKTTGIKFDAIFSFSSIEHSGLGRYGDPINPAGDIESMRVFSSLLKPNGLLYLSVPLGKKNILVWNHHRIYGKSRFSRLINEFSILKVFGRHSENINDYFFGDNNWQNQPVIVLKKIT